MKRICYMSRVSADARPGVIDDLLRVSEKNNTAAGITGLLLCDGARFLQAIEGSDPSIDDCYKRIKADQRHYDIAELENAAIDQREFGHWSLNYRSQLAGDAISFRRLVAEDVAVVKKDSLRAMFIGFAALAR